MKALIVAGRGTTDQEFVYPYYRLKEAGFEVDVAVRGKETVKGIIGVDIVPTMDIPGNAVGFDLLVLPGGVKAMEKLRQDAALIAMIAKYHYSGGVIASICHAAQLLISAKLVKGRKVSGYYSIRDDITNAGGTYTEDVVDFDRIISAAHYKDMGPWMAAVFASLEREKAFRDAA